MAGVGRSDPLTHLSAHERALVRPGPPPRRVEPQLATRAASIPRGPGWIAERKLDGVRLHVHLEADALRLLTRTGRDRAPNLPELAAPLRALGPAQLVADAEVVALVDGRERFQQVLRRIAPQSVANPAPPDVAVFLYLFDLLHLEGMDLRDVPLEGRKRVLRTLRFQEPVRFVDHLAGDLDVAFHLACDQEWEGLIVKRADLPYRPGRTSSWRKLVCARSGRFLVGGWTSPRGRRTGVGALLVGSPTSQGLRYDGRVGSGLEAPTLAALAEHLPTIERVEPPFANPPADRDLRWAIPHLVVELRHLGRTDEGRLRQPTLVRLRPDLDAGDLRSSEREEGPVRSN